MTLMLVLSRTWHGIDLHLDDPRRWASWILLGWIALAVVPDRRSGRDCLDDWPVVIDPNYCR